MHAEWLDDRQLPARLLAGAGASRLAPRPGVGRARPIDGRRRQGLDGLGAAIEGARWATVALFISPGFLYRPELGATTASGSLRLTNYEIASRLSFLVWGSLPDKMLLDQAASGMLDSATGF